MSPWPWRKAVLLLCLVGLLTGCWNRREIQELAIVTGIGVDWNAETEQYELTIQVARPALVPRPGEAAGAGGPGREPYFFALTSGPTFAEAISNALESRTRRLYLPHLQSVVFGEDLARKGLTEILDWLWRHPDVRPFVDLLVAKGKAREVFAGKAPLEDISGRAMVLLMERAAPHGRARSATLLDVMYAFATPGTAAFQPAITLRNTGTPSTEVSPGFDEFKVDGIGVFDRDRLVAFLNESESRGAMWARGDIRQTTVTVPGRRGLLTSFSLRGVKRQVQVVPQGAGKLPLMRLTVRADARMLQQESPLTSTPDEVLAFLEGALSRKIKAEIEAAIAATKSAGADVIGFSESLRRADPNLWHQVSANWDERYRDLPVEVTVEVYIRTTGMLR